VFLGILTSNAAIAERLRCRVVQL